MKPRRDARRRGYTLTIVLVVMFLVLGMVAAVAAITRLELADARTRALDACATEALTSAQAWSRRHAVELLTAQAPTTVLPLADVLPAGVGGEVVLQVRAAPDGARLAVATVRLERSGRRFTRQVRWELTPPPLRDAGP